MKNFDPEDTNRQRAPSRRRFLQSTVAGAILTGGLKINGLEASAAKSEHLLRESAEVNGVADIGGLQSRIELTQHRLTAPDGFPAYTKDFVLADVKLDPQYPRLYSNFSGDVSGRYIEALSVLPPSSDVPQLHSLVRELLIYQRADGRYGNEHLKFTPDEINREHMALLWGNGRLLTGLMAYRARQNAVDVLPAARRLGDFLIRVRNVCSQPEVIKRVEGAGAFGPVCLTQLIEGLVMLSRAAGDARYTEAAKQIVPLLPDRHTPALHSHGYLSTLRGILQIYEATGEKQYLEKTESLYREIGASPDYTVYGGVLEFFGAEHHGISADDIKKLTAFDNKDPQDEGCSESDFLRLSLLLWRATGKNEYLDLAERCLHNHFFFNQFSTGDFGHHVIFSNGFRATQQTGMAWWCCTMHGLRTFRDILDSVISSPEDSVVRINLYLDAKWSDEKINLSMTKSPPANEHATDYRFTINVDDDTAGEVALALRRPPWAERMTIAVEGKAVKGESTSDGYVRLQRKWRRGARVDVSFVPRVRIQTRDNKLLQLEEIGREPVEGALLYGPYVMGVHETQEPLFLRRPWMFATAGNANIIRLPTNFSAARLATEDAHGLTGSIRCQFDYDHGGWPGTYKVILSPISDQTHYAAQQTLAVWLKYARA